jgi:hypothetical protein
LCPSGWRLWKSFGGFFFYSFVFHCFLITYMDRLWWWETTLCCCFPAAASGLWKTAFQKNTGILQTDRQTRTLCYVSDFCATQGDRHAANCEIDPFFLFSFLGLCLWLCDSECGGWFPESKIPSRIRTLAETE